MAFQGRLVAGVGNALRIYDIGKKKLLRKVENKVSGHLLSLEPQTHLVVDLLIPDHHIGNSGFADHRW